MYNSINRPFLLLQSGMYRPATQENSTLKYFDPTYDFENRCISFPTPFLDLSRPSILVKLVVTRDDNNVLREDNNT